MSEGVRCMWMRGGTSKGGYFLERDLPADRDAFLLSVMGSPDPRQIDGMGGANSLTSKVAVVRPSTREGIDVDYLFLQVKVDEAVVTDAQNCGNILAGVGPFAIERGLVKPRGETTPVKIFMENSAKVAIAEVATPGGAVRYAGEAAIDGVPGHHAAVPLTFEGLAGATCGALLPTGNPLDTVEGVAVTLIDNGMPVALIRAADLGVTGREAPHELEANGDLKARLEALRLAAGRLMNLGDVDEKTVPKMTLIAPPEAGGVIATRSFIPHTVHASIGVFAAVSVASGCAIDGTVADGIAEPPASRDDPYLVEHPSGSTPTILRFQDGGLAAAGMVRTARKLFDGVIFAAEPAG